MAATFDSHSPSPSVAGEVLLKLRQPSRLRGRVIFTITALILIVLLLAAQRNNINYIGDYVSVSLRPTYNSEGLTWGNGVNSENATYDKEKKPKFHLAIPAKNTSLGLCKTLLSAAILGYPPPTLVGYGTEEDERPDQTAIRNTFDFLVGQEVQQDDLVLIISDDTWLQLPADVMISRFMQNSKEATLRLLQKYGEQGNGKQTPSSPGVPIPKSPRFYQKVLFGATKSCTPASNVDNACYWVPWSTLPHDTYGPNTDRALDGPESRPRYISSSTSIGRASDLRVVYKYASDKIEHENIGSQGSDTVFAQLFGEQELQRELVRKASQGFGARWKDWLSRISGPLEYMSPTNSSASKAPLSPGKLYEYGIGIDYESSLFQVMTGSMNDVDFVKFQDLNISSRENGKVTSNSLTPISLPADISNCSLPYRQHKQPEKSSIMPMTELDEVPKDAQWSDVSLATNIVVPGTRVPAALSFGEHQDLLKDWWEKIWFAEHSRALFRQYIRSSTGTVAAEAAKEGGDRWWDLRGGKGGVWTDKGEWLEWNEVCREFEDELFHDGKGGSGLEGSETPIYNGFGVLIAGKEQPKVDEEE